jgi:NAD(P)-dependent dehydrogenase (short-subunit alcohol dehydrogenase family)
VYDHFMPTALVTGANRGLGLEVARQLGERGFTVFAGFRDPARVPRLAGNVKPVQLDVTDEVSVADAVRSIPELDVLVNNAAVGDGTGHLVLDGDFELARQAIETNTIGPWRVSVACAHLLRASPSGRIVNISSEIASLSQMGNESPAYLLSKAGLNALTRMLAAALAEDRVLVNSVCPGWVATDMGGPGGRPVSEGAAGVVWAATLPDDGPTGGFFRDSQPLDW